MLRIELEWDVSWNQMVNPNPKLSVLHGEYPANPITVYQLGNSILVQSFWFGESVVKTISFK